MHIEGGKGEIAHCVCIGRTGSVEKRTKTSDSYNTEGKKRGVKRVSGEERIATDEKRRQL